MRTLVAALFLVATVGAARAAPPDAATVKSKELFTHAEALYALTRFDEALAEYERAFEMKPLPGFLFNIGQCMRQLGRWEKAGYFYRTYLDREPDARNRALVESLIVEMDEKARGGVVLRSDGNPMAPPPGTAPIAPPVVEPAPARPTVAIPAEPASPTVRATHTPDAHSGDTPIYRRWWLWAGVGAVVLVALAVGLGVGLSGGLPHGSLSTIDAR